jgi:hypothetical protein
VAKDILYLSTRTSDSGSSRSVLKPYLDALVVGKQTPLWTVFYVQQEPSWGRHDIPPHLLVLESEVATADSSDGAVTAAHTAWRTIVGSEGETPDSMFEREEEVDDEG